MSSATDNMKSCANCGKGEEASGDLKACTACKSVKYCNRECQIVHRPQHKKACKKRAAELHDEELFEQPVLNEDCPVCMIPLPSLEPGSKYQVCAEIIIMLYGCILLPSLINNILTLFLLTFQGLLWKIYMLWMHPCCYNERHERKEMSILQNSTLGYSRGVN